MRSRAEPYGNLISELGTFGITNALDKGWRQCWRDQLSEREPEVWCICGSYINAAVLERLLGSVDDLQGSSWSDAHGNASTKGDEHHDHSERGGKDYLKSIDWKSLAKLSDKHTFKLHEGLKFRQEQNGLLIAIGLNGFLVNRLGEQILRPLRETQTVSLGDLKKRGSQLGVSEESVENFLQHLAVFGVVTVR